MQIETTRYHYFPPEGLTLQTDNPTDGEAVEHPDSQLFVGVQNGYNHFGKKSGGSL